MIKVKNLNPTPHYNCACGTWLKHWQKFSLKRSAECAVPDCSGTALEGVHVQKADSDDERWYVVPLCVQHSAGSSELEIAETVKLVSADRETTCERW